VALAALFEQRRRCVFWGTAALLGVFAAYHVVTLRAFYPDPRPAAAWLHAHVTAHDDPILVDDTYPYRYALADIFDGRESWVVDQWWWQNVQATPATWRALIQQGTFSFIVFEEGGAFSGAGSVFDASVIEAVRESGRYRLVGEFRSNVTWGNAILFPFQGQLQHYSVVPTEVWVRTSGSSVSKEGRFR
jgi:hypothetical protein